MTLYWINLVYILSITIFGIVSVYRLTYLYKDIQKEHGSSQRKEVKPVSEDYIRVRVRNDLEKFDDEEFFLNHCLS